MSPLPPQNPNNTNNSTNSKGCPTLKGLLRASYTWVIYKPSVQVSKLRLRIHWEEAKPGCNPSLCDLAISSQHCRPDQGPSDHTLQGPWAHLCPWSFPQTSQALLIPSASPGVRPLIKHPQVPRQGTDWSLTFTYFVFRSWKSPSFLFSSSRIS